MNPRMPKLLVRDAAVPAVALAGLALVLLTQANQRLFLAINGITSQFPDVLWSHWTVLGDGLLILVLVLPWVGRRPDIIWAVWLSALVVTVAVHVLKPWIGAARPPAVLDPSVFHVVGHALHSGAFPSGHTAAAFAFAGVVAMHLRRAWVTAAVLVMAAGVGLSRIAVGAHWPVDVLAGAAIGWAGACAAVLIAARWRWGISARGQKVTALLLVFAGGVMLWGYDTGYADAAWMQRVLALLSLAVAATGLVRVWRGLDSPKVGGEKEPQL